MINNFANPKSISVPSVHTGCCKTEFDSTYQNDLNGVISQNEFQESINKINRRISSTKFIVMFVLVFGFCIIGTIVSFIVGLITSGDFIFIGVAIALFLFGLTFIFVGCFIVQRRSAERIRKAIAQESRKYSTRSPILCRWRLKTTTEYDEEYGNQHSHQLVIDVSRSINSELITTESPSWIVGHHDNNAPPPYSSLSMGFCS
ncbi:unnamed protein product [Adineta steineri]|uniref:Uncharacterized protein n=1 Tax=Adineta steineri TaxID=433720 RepID=A0A816BRG0_9BILA|nr:unnamed protein product [Adineta steineri]CAF1612438.1 unnamed protein product [Adineta steineri]